MQTKSIDRITLVNITLFVEAALLLVATFWSQIAGIGLAPALARKPDFLIGIGAGFGLAFLSLVLFWLGKIIPPLADLRKLIIEQLAPIFSDLKIFDVILVALVSGFCEEVLFRGVIQQQFGIVAASVIFGLFHCPGLRHLSYGLWAFVAGFFLGWLFQTTGSLWVPIFAHAVSNIISLLFLRYGIKTPPPLPDK